VALVKRHETAPWLRRLAQRQRHL